jgi:hypothetical protein
MAGPLTWRNVDAPDASTAMKGLKQMTDMLGKAFGGAATGLGDFKDQRAAAADQAGLAASLKFTDPAQYQEALRNGLIPQENMTAEGTANLGNRATQLLNQQALGQDFKTGEQNLLKGEQVLRAGDQLFGQRNTAADILAHNYQRQLTQEGRADALHADTKSADAATRQLKTDFVDPTSVRDSVLALKGTMSPEAYNMIYDKAVADYGIDKLPAYTGKTDTLGRPIADTTPTDSTSHRQSAPGTAGTAKGSAWDMAVGGVATPKPLTEMTGAEVIKFGKDVLIPGNKGKFGNDGGTPNDPSDDVGSSASGAYQITGSIYAEYAPKVIGKDWETQPFSAVNQDKVAEALFNDRKGGDLSKTWVGLQNHQPGFFKDVPWSEMRQMITRAESNDGQPLEDVRGALTASARPIDANQVAATELAGKDKNTVNTFLSGAAEAHRTGLGNTDDIYKVSKDFALKTGTDPIKAREAIERVQARINRNPTIAAALIEKSLDPTGIASTILDYTPGSGYYDIGGSQFIHPDDLDRYVEASNSGTALDSAMALDQGKASNSNVGAFREEYTAAQKLLTDVEAKAKAGNTQAKAALPRIRASANKADELLRAAMRGDVARK